MNTNVFLTGILVAAALVAGTARGADTSIEVVAEQGTTIAAFKVGDSRCVLKDDRLSCIPLTK
jgi:serine/threonine protein phosphatase PrpC